MVTFSRRAFLASAAAGSVGQICLRAQEPTFSTDVKVVSVFATVHDKQGRAVSNLTRDDFNLTEDGRRQTIQYFSRESNLPLTLGLLVDTSLSQRTVLGEERTASYRFFEKVLREDRDLAFVIHFDHDTELLQDLTASRSRLEHALNQLQLPDDQPQQSRRGGGFPGGGGYPGQGRQVDTRPGTTLYDAILLASDELMRKQQGRKALILLTDGVDNGSKVSLNRAIEAAQRADTLVYSILFTGEEGYAQQPIGGFGGYGGRRGGRGGGNRFPPVQQRQQPDGKRVLRQLSSETGGGFFEVSRKDPIDRIYDRIQEDLRSQYSLGYSSDKMDTDGAYRRINVTVQDRNLIVQTREGYYAGR